LDISDLQIPLSDFKLLNMILNDDEHGDVKNLTASKVQALDEWAVKLKLDTYLYLYIGRTRIGDDTGYQVEVIFYGQDRNCPDV
jgi:hypothetical protein